MQNFKIQFKPILTLCQQLYGPVIICHTQPQLTNSTDLNSASADQLGATKWH